MRQRALFRYQQAQSSRKEVYLFRKSAGKIQV